MSVFGSCRGCSAGLGCGREGWRHQLMLHVRSSFRTDTLGDTEATTRSSKQQEEEEGEEFQVLDCALNQVPAVTEQRHCLVFIFIAKNCPEELDEMEGHGAGLSPAPRGSWLSSWDPNSCSTCPSPGPRDKPVPTPDQGLPALGLPSSQNSHKCQ